MEELYKNCEYNIQVYKTKDMKYSKQIITGNSKIGICVGLSSLLQSCIENKLITEKELQEMVNTIAEVRKTGVKNRVIFSNWEAENE